MKGVREEGLEGGGRKWQRGGDKGGTAGRRRGMLSFWQYFLLLRLVKKDFLRIHPMSHPTVLYALGTR